MSFDPTPAFKVAYGDTFDLLYQQLTEATRQAVRIKTNVRGTRQSYETVGADEAVPLTSRHADTKYLALPEGKRWADIVFYVANELIDEEDEMRMITSIESAYTQALAGSLARRVDLVTLGAAIGTATTGTDETITGTQVLPAGQKIDVAFGTFTGLSLAKIVEASRLLDAAEVPKDDRHIFHGPTQLANLLNDSTITSGDFNSIKLLMQGAINSFMGFQWHLTNRLTLDGNGDRQVTCWHRFSMGLAFSMEKVTRIERIPLKNYALQVYNKMGLGAVRIQDNGVVEIACTEPGA